MLAASVSKIFRTDFYQLMMATVYFSEDAAVNRKVCFEAFVRNIRKEVNPTGDFYIFNSENEVIDFLEQVRRDVQNQEFIDAFCEFMYGRARQELLDTIRSNYAKLDKTFQYFVYPNNGIVRPYIPVFQFIGPIWIGQLIETYLLCLINGRTGRATKQYIGDNRYEAEYKILFDEDEIPDKYALAIEKRAKEYVIKSPVPLFDGSLRRSPTYKAAVRASEVCLHSGWKGTGNLGSAIDGTVNLEQVGGSMAHSFVLSRICQTVMEELKAGIPANQIEFIEKRNERYGFKQWGGIFPLGSILTDTYDVFQAVNTILEEGLTPLDIRIDSPPLDNYCVRAHIAFQQANKAIGNYISGDLEPDQLQDMGRRKIPFVRAQAGTKFVNDWAPADAINAGFVYKLTAMRIETNNGPIWYAPQKKSTGKMNHPGIKSIAFENDIIVMKEANPAIEEIEMLFENSKHAIGKVKSTNCSVVYPSKLSQQI